MHENSADLVFVNTNKSVLLNFYKHLSITQNFDAEISVFNKF